MTGDRERARMDATEWLLLLREEPADQAQIARFEEWRLASPTHDAAWQSIQATFAVVGETEPTRPEYRRSGLVRRQFTRCSRERRDEQTHRAPRRRRVIIATAVAACAALLLTPTLRMHLAADHITAAGRTEQIRLEDGSNIRLGPDSAIAVDYERNSRNIRLLSGQAWFEVQHNPSRPFHVQAGNLSTTVLGTAFDVRMIGDVTSVCVGRGRVRVESGSTVLLTRELRAGDWVQLDHGAHVEGGHGAAELAGDWREGRVYVRDRLVADVVDEIRPWYFGKIILASDEIAQRRVSGVFKVDDPENALQALTSSRGGRIMRISPWLMIVTAQ